MKLVKKVYSSTHADISFIYKVEVGELITNHVFQLDSNGTCTVIDPEKQKAIEESKHFKNGSLKLKSQSSPTPAEIDQHNKQVRKESRIIELAKTRPDISEKVMETAQIKVIDPSIKTADQIVNEELGKIEGNEDVLPNDAASEDEDAKDDINPEQSDATEEDHSPEKGYRSIPEVTNIQQAKEVLRKEYEVPFQKLNKPDAILKIAESLNVEFPNLKV